ncbi:gp53-like domain-containing protein [Aeromonas sp. 30P]|uniref:gp53-like domain-containing protein n=1 Tax=Aeromonas sp. 30P TaxID=3452717 RepID=UPI003F78D8A2
MHRIDTSTAQKDKFGAGKNGFTLGNAQTGVPPTEVSDDILDALQEEIAAVIEDQDSGMTLDKTKNNQLLTAIKKIIRSVGLASTEAVRGAIKIATQDQVNSGSADDAAVTPKKLRAGFSISLTSQPYVCFPSWLGGWIIQMGDSAPSMSRTTWPIAFPTRCISAAVLSKSSATTITYDSLEATGTSFSLQSSTTGANQPAASCKYIAVGY